LRFIIVSDLVQLPFSIYACFTFLLLKEGFTYFFLHNLQFIDKVDSAILFGRWALIGFFFKVKEVSDTQASSLAGALAPWLLNLIVFCCHLRGLTDIELYQVKQACAFFDHVRVFDFDFLLPCQEVNSLVGVRLTSSRQVLQDQFVVFLSLRNGLAGRGNFDCMVLRRAVVCLIRKTESGCP
jgi:hypothetical protein